MRTLLIPLAAATLIGATAHAQAPTTSNTRTTLRNDVGIELLGKALIYSFTYQRMVTSAVGLEAGLGALGGSDGGDNTTVVFVPLGARFYLIPKSGSLFLSAGTVFATAATAEGPLDTASDFYGQAGLGFEMRSTGGFTFRAAAYVLFADGGYFIWPGLGFGYAF